MKRIVALCACGLFTLAAAPAQQGPYRVLKTVKVGGIGGYDYVYADSAGRKLYVPRTGSPGRVSVFHLDTLAPAGEIADTNARGVAVDVETGHAFASSKPVAMWDAATLQPIKTIDVQGAPDGILDDPFNHRVYVLSHSAPNVTVIDARDGAVLGTIDLGGAPEQAVSDGQGRLYVDLEDKDNIAVIDAKTMAVTAHYDLSPKGGECAGLAMDRTHHLLFASCRKPQTMVILNAADGSILAALPIGAGTDGAVFNPQTMEAFSSQGDGTLTVVRENSPTSFAVAQTVATPTHARTLTLDSKTGHILLITAGFGPAPPLQPGERYARAPMLPDTFSILVVGRK